jgi:hypothetical protein
VPGGSCLASPVGITRSWVTGWSASLHPFLIILNHGIGDVPVPRTIFEVIAKITQLCICSRVDFKHLWKPYSVTRLRRNTREGLKKGECPEPS